MLFWIILGAIVIAGGLIGVNVDSDISSRRERALTALAGLALGALIGLCVSLFACMMVASAFKPSPTYSAPDRPAKIISFEDHVEEQTNSAGTFLVIVGGYNSHEDTKLSYRFYQEAPDGTYFLHNVEVDGNTSVHLRLAGPDVTPTAERRQPNEHWVTEGWIAPMDLNPDTNGEADEEWVITVPRGTVVQKFKADGN